MCLVARHTKAERVRSSARTIRVSSSKVELVEKQLLEWLSKSAAPISADELIIRGRPLGRHMSPLLIRASLAVMAKRGTIIKSGNDWTIPDRIR